MAAREPGYVGVLPGLSGLLRKARAENDIHPRRRGAGSILVFVQSSVGLRGCDCRKLIRHGSRDKSAVQC